MEKIQNLITKLTNSLQERNKAIKLSMLALLSGESIFFLGPPGVAKSLVSRKIKESIKDSKNFEYLMNRFSTPDEIFGPISLKKLDEDIYERKIEGYLPSSNVAFLDEIWKASPAIQNTLLTIINEHIYQNGNNVIDVPLKILIAASNELPAKDEGLEALFDRFIIRLYVENVVNKDSFRKVIDTTLDTSGPIEEKEKITLKEIEEIKNNSKNIKIDDNTFNFILNLKNKLNVELKENAPYISDRRWKKIVSILKTSAYASNRQNIEPVDWLLVPNMIWENIDQYELIQNVFHDVWINEVINSNSLVAFEEINKKIEVIKNEYNSNLKSLKKKREYSNSDNKKYYIYKNKNDSNDQYYYLINKDDIKILNGNNTISAIKQNKSYIDISKNKMNDFTNINNSNSYNYGYSYNRKYSWFDISINTPITKDAILINNIYEAIYDEKYEMSPREIENIKNKIAKLGSEIGSLQYAKKQILENLKKHNSLFIDDYNHAILQFEKKYNYNIDEISKIRDELSVNLIKLSDKVKDKLLNDENNENDDISVPLWG